MADWELAVERIAGEVRVLSATVQQHIADDKEKWDRNSETHKDLYIRTERPSWMVTWALGGLMSAVVGLAVYLVTRG